MFKDSYSGLHKLSSPDHIVHRYAGSICRRLTDNKIMHSPDDDNGKYSNKKVFISTISNSICSKRCIMCKMYFKIQLEIHITIL